MEGTCICIAYDTAVLLYNKIWIFGTDIFDSVCKFLYRRDLVLECYRRLFNIRSVDFYKFRCIHKAYFSYDDVFIFIYYLFLII